MVTSGSRLFVRTGLNVQDDDDDRVTIVTGETELVPLLEENLDQEKEALAAVEQAAPRLSHAAA